MNNLMNKKLLLKILSGVIAVILWFAITYTEDPVISQTVMNVPLSFEGEETLNNSGFVIVEKNDIPDINVTVRGSRSNVIASLGSIGAIADVSKITSVGKNTVPIRYSYMSGSISIIKSKTTEIEVNVEKLVSREIPVKTEITNYDKSFEKIVEPILKTETITVSGAESVVYKVAYAKAVVDLSNIQKSSSQEYMYNLYGENNNIIAENNITHKSRKTVSVDSIVYDKTKLLPIKVVLDSSKQDDFGFLVKSIEKETVHVGIKDDSVSVNYIEAIVKPEENEGKYTASLVVPEGIYLSDSEKNIWVTGEILPKKLVEMTVDIEAINLPDGKLATISPHQKTITLKTIKQEPEISATVDISKMKSNEEQLNLNFNTDSDTEIIGNYSVFVKLTNMGE